MRLMLAVERVSHPYRLVEQEPREEETVLARQAVNGHDVS
jgi:hypothetical protein